MILFPIGMCFHNFSFVYDYRNLKDFWNYGKNSTQEVVLTILAILDDAIGGRSTNLYSSIFTG